MLNSTAGPMSQAIIFFSLNIIFLSIAGVFCALLMRNVLASVYRVGALTGGTCVVSLANVDLRRTTPRSGCHTAVNIYVWPDCTVRRIEVGWRDSMFGRATTVNT